MNAIAVLDNGEHLPSVNRDISWTREIWTAHKGWQPSCRLTGQSRERWNALVIWKDNWEKALTH